MNALAVVIAVLSYNVHGLNHWLVDDDPEARMPAISARVNAYDVALIQESWTYWDALAAQVTHSVRERGNGPDPGMFFQTGLTSFARPAFVAVSRGSLGACSGWLGGANECFADKGFLRLRLRLANGVELDFWNLHLDAGDSDDDRAARALQLDSLVARVHEQVRSVLADSLRMVVSQQLVRKADGTGRVAVPEVLINTQAAASMIRKGRTHQLASVIQSGSRQGMCSLDARLQELVRTEVITGEEAYEHAIDKGPFERYLLEDALA